MPAHRAEPIASSVDVWLKTQFVISDRIHVWHHCSGFTIPLIDSQVGRCFKAPPLSLTASAADEDVVDTSFSAWTCDKEEEEVEKRGPEVSDFRPSESMVTDGADVHSPIKFRE